MQAHGPKESRHRSNEGESVTYVMFKHFGGFLKFVFTREVACASQLQVLHTAASFLEGVERGWGGGVGGHL